MLRRSIIAAALAAFAAGDARAQDSAKDTIKVGLSIPMTGAGFNAVGRQINAAVRLYMAQHGDTVAGKKIELIIRDDGGVADNARRIVQDMIVNDHVAVIGAGITPTALAIAPLVTRRRSRPW